MSPSTQIELANHFRALHDRRRLLLLPNAWDAGSARLFTDLGFAAIATTSGGVAWSLGYADGEHAPLDEVLATMRRIVRATHLPVSTDFEAGYATTPAELGANVRALIATGIVGINLEDGVRHTHLRSIDDASSRIAAAREAALATGVPLFINARVDVWITGVGTSEAERIEETLRRSHAYLAAGANGIYPIGLRDQASIATLAASLEAPINLTAAPGLPGLAALGRLGIARVSTATRLSMLALSAAGDAARAVRDSGRFDALDASLTHLDMQRLFGH